MTEKLQKRTYLLGSNGAGVSVSTTTGWHKLSRDKSYIQTEGTYGGVIVIELSGNASTPVTALTLTAGAENGYEIDTAAGYIRINYTHTTGSVTAYINE